MSTASIRPLNDSGENAGWPRPASESTPCRIRRHVVVPRRHSRLKHNKASNPATAGIGIVLNIVAIIAGSYTMLTFFKIVDDFGVAMEDTGNK